MYKVHCQTKIFCYEIHYFQGILYAWIWTWDMEDCMCARRKGKVNTSTVHGLWLPAFLLSITTSSQHAHCTSSIRSSYIACKRRASWICRMLCPADNLPHIYYRSNGQRPCAFTTTITIYIYWPHHAWSWSSTKGIALTQIREPMAMATTSKDDMRKKIEQLVNIRVLAQWQNRPNLTLLLSFSLALTHNPAPASIDSTLYSYLFIPFAFFFSAIFPPHSFIIHIYYK